jgi:hypothetical protein
MQNEIESFEKVLGFPACFGKRIAGNSALNLMAKRCRNGGFLACSLLETNLVLVWTAQLSCWFQKIHINSKPPKHTKTIVSRVFNQSPVEKLALRSPKGFNFTPIVSSFILF